MVFTEPGSAREEAERLVAAGLAFASLAANAHPEIATGSAACCVCPFCKLIEAVRDPDPQLVERLATGAGDLAVGVAGLLRSLSGMTRPPADAWTRATAEEPPAYDSRAARAETEAALAAAAAREAARESEAPQRKPATERSREVPGVQSAERSREAPGVQSAKKAVKKAVPPIVPESGMAAGPHDGVETALTQTKPLAKKAVAKKAIKKAMPKPTPGASG